MTFLKQFFITCCILLPVCFLHTGSSAQEILNKTISFDVKQKPLRDVLVMIGKQRNFYFSYNTNSIPKDSLVTLSVREKPIRTVLNMLLGENCQYKETDNHIIIQQAEHEKWFTISGYLVDGITGEKVADASVFEEQQLVATLSDAQGYFKLRLKDREKYAAARIRVSKGFYRDTIVTTGQGYDQELLIPFHPADYELPGIEITPYAEVERSWFGKHLFSSKLRKQSANLGKFFVDKPMQVSFVPGLGTHGRMSGQVTNRVSFNVVGGYTAGVDGFELGGIFNINKKDVKHVQIAGISNIVGGSAEGLQIGGIFNNVSGSVRGMQVTGIASHTKKNFRGFAVAGISGNVGGNMTGMQLSGISNYVRNKDTALLRTKAYTDSVRGMQLSGIVNVAYANMKGVQLTAISNVCKGNIDGLQMSAIVNHAKKVTGMQIGLINIADTVDGYSLGFLNIIKKGYHKFDVSSNETFNINGAYKAGNKKLYSIISVGYNAEAGKRSFGHGYGLGHESMITKKVGLCSELSVNEVFLPDFDNSLVLLRLQTSFNFTIFKQLSVYTGPAVSFCAALPEKRVDGYLPGVPSSAIKGYDTGNNTALWIGWQAGIALF